MKIKLLMIFIGMCFQTLLASNPDYQLILENDSQISSSEYQFDVYIAPAGTTSSFTLASYQLVITFNTAISSSPATDLTLSVVANTSDLNSYQDTPTSISISGNLLKISVDPPGSTHGTLIDGAKRIATFQLTNSGSFVGGEKANLGWKNSTSGNPYTIITAYIGTTNTDITNDNNSNQLSDPALPVELTSFTAFANNNAVNLTWKTATEVNNYGFDVQRAAPLNPPQGGTSGTSWGSWKKIGFVQGAGNSNSPKSYSFTDDNPSGGTKFLYRLKQEDIDGKYKYSDTVEVTIPVQYALFQNYPNPFNPTTKIRFSIPQASRVSLVIYNIIGQVVANLVNNEYLNAGYHSASFNGMRLASGTYIYRLQAGSFVQIKKMILLK